MYLGWWEMQQFVQIREHNNFNGKASHDNKYINVTLYNHGICYCAANMNDLDTYFEFEDIANNQLIL